MEKALSVGAVETLGGEEMRDERVTLSFSRKTSVSISALWTAWKLGDVKSADKMEGGKWGMTLPGRPSWTNDAKALTTLARRSGEGFVVEWRLEIRVDGRHRLPEINFLSTSR